MTRDFLGMGTTSKRILGKIRVELNKEEERLVEDIIDPKDIRESFHCVGGLERAKEILTENVIWPFQRPDLFPQGSLRTHPTGVLLYGPPGTGKTLLARALAKELDGYFLEVCVEKLFAKWVGDSEKLAAAVFSLANKLGSCIIFIDEIDSLLSSRSDSDSTVYAHAKTIFLTKWDGLVQASPDVKVLVVGATNRPKSLDDAILRRMPIRVEIQYPDFDARRDILAIHLSEALEGNPNAEKIVTGVARRTVGYSGSDLKELCKVAAMVPVRSVMKKETETLPRLDMAHFEEALTKVTATSLF